MFEAKTRRSKRNLLDPRPFISVKEKTMPDREETAPIRSIHGHTGPTTPSEDAARESPSASADEKIRIAEAASREEDA